MWDLGKIEVNLSNGTDSICRVNLEELLGWFGQFLSLAVLIQLLVLMLMYWCWAVAWCVKIKVKLFVV